VSPFIDKNFLAGQVSKGPTRAKRVLLSTMREIERIGPSLSSFDDLLALDAPTIHRRSRPKPAHPVSASEQILRMTRRRSAEASTPNCCFVRAGRKRTLWLGSANATMQAWTAATPRSQPSCMSPRL
jgi:hypothetical protein